MNVKFNFRKQIFEKKAEDSVFFVDDKFNISNIKKSISSSEYSYILDLLKISDKQKKILSFEINSNLSCWS